MALLRLTLPLLLVTICFGSEVSSSEGSCDRQGGVGCNDKSDDDQILLQGKLNLTKLDKQSSTNPGKQHLTKMAKPNLPKVVKQTLKKMAQQNLPKVAKVPVQTCPFCLSKKAKIAEARKHTVHQEEPDFDPSSFSDTMTVSAVVEIGGDSPQEGILVAFVGEDSVRGVQETPSVPPFGPYKGKSIYQITLYANKGGEKMWFVFVTPDGTPSKLDETLDFVVNGNMGNVVKPMELHAPTPPPPPAGCKNDDATVIANAANYGITISGCAEAETFCKHPEAYEPCPVTCDTCKGPAPTEPPAPAACTEDWAITPSDYENSMSMTAAIFIGDVSPQDGALAAFAGKCVRGIQDTPSIVPFGPYKGKALFQLMIYGEGGGETITFKFKTPGGDIIPLDEKVVFKPDDAIGNAVDAFKLTAPPPCTSDDATVVANAKQYGITISGCADVKQEWCGMEAAYEPCGCVCGK